MVVRNLGRCRPGSQAPPKSDHLHQLFKSTRLTKVAIFASVNTPSNELDMWDTFYFVAVVRDRCKVWIRLFGNRMFAPSHTRAS